MNATAPPGGGERLLGEGSSAEVFDIGGGEVAKLFRPGVAPSMVEREYAAAQLACAQGVRVAAPLGRETRAGRELIRYQRVDGQSMLSVLNRAPRKALPAMLRLARIHAGIHRRPAQGPLRSQLEVLATDIHHGPADAAWKSAALDDLAKRPPGEHLCHGDLHPGNVIEAPQGATVIDWSKASIGHPAADVARTELLLRFAPVQGNLSEVTAARFGRWLAAMVYVRAYLQLTGMRRSEVLAWHLPTAVSWMHFRADARGDGFERYVAALVARRQDAG